MKRAANAVADFFVLVALWFFLNAICVLGRIAARKRAMVRRGSVAPSFAGVLVILALSWFAWPAVKMDTSEEWPALQRTANTAAILVLDNPVQGDVVYLPSPCDDELDQR